MASVTVDLEEYEQLKKENDSLKKEKKELERQLDNANKVFNKIVFGNPEKTGIEPYMVDFSTFDTFIVQDLQIPTLKHCYTKFDIDTTKYYERHWYD